MSRGSERQHGLVINTEPSRRGPINEPTGEPESLSSRVQKLKMGDRFQRNRPETARKRAAAGGDAESAAKRLRQGSGKLPGAQTFGAYRPRSQESQAAYEELLANLRPLLGDAPHEVLFDVANDVLDALKSTAIKDSDKKAPVEEPLGVVLSAEQFAKLLNISRRINDYTAPGEQAAGADGAVPGVEGDGLAGEMGTDYGVAVVFEDDDEQQGGGATGIDQEIELHSRVLKTQKEEEDDEDEEGVDTHMAAQLGTIDADDDEDGDAGGGLDPRKIDAYWIQREMGPLDENEEAEQAQANAEKVLQLLADDGLTDQMVENQLVLLFQYKNFPFIQLVLRNRWKVVFCTRLARAEDDAARQAIEREMEQRESLLPILEELRSGTFRERHTTESKEFRRQVRGANQGGPAGPGGLVDDSAAPAPEARFAAPSSKGANDASTRALVDLETLAFEQAGHFMSNKKCELPKGSVREGKKGYEEVHVPAVRPKEHAAGACLKVAEAFPEWAKAAFSEVRELNPIQSKLFPAAFGTQENLLLCAPTGAGKTNVALLTILAEVAKHVDADGKVDLDDWKVVYVAPMKALVQELVHDLGERLKAYGIVVSELTGDRQMTKHQIGETQIIVTTPEKWDIVTRKSGDRTYTQQVRLLIIDEIHLLHDERGPVLEALVARTLRQVEATQELIRIVGLSATLPNYHDVAAFLRVSPEKGLFYFDNTYRPVPLQQQYIGITEKKPLKRFQLMNEIAYEKVLEKAGKNQVLVFVHSRKDTSKTAKALRDMALERDTIGRFLREDSASREILHEEAANAKNGELKDLLPYAFGIHHAGMLRRDRTLVEDLFRDGHIQVLVSTATLAWGVNLPAHTVIIKGTQIYNPEKGRWVELSALDVMQMMGRAGRIKYDTRGEGIIITTHGELQYYLSLMNQQLPIESQMISRLPDQLNAEVVLGTVQNAREAVTWLGYSYLYVRMLRNPELYGITRRDLEEDPYLERYRADLVHTAATVLDRCNLIKYDRRTGQFQVTDLGRVASHFYLSHKSVHTYNEHLKPTMMDLEVFRLFALSNEFSNIVVREEEKPELQRLLERVPVPVKETVEEPAAKVNVLLQAYISNLKLEGYALMADMVYVTQSAARIMRALHEVVLRRGWAQLTERMLNIAKMVERRMWLSHSPLRQFPQIPEEVIKKLERKEFSWDRFYDLSPADLGDLVHNPKVGKNVYKFVHQLPRLELAAKVQPITRTTLRVELTVVPDFQFDVKVHGAAESFWVLIEDVDGEHILHYEQFVLKAKFAKEEHYLYFTVPIQEPLPPQYFVRVVSERWLWSESLLPVSFRHLILPERPPPHTELLDLQPLPLSALRNPVLEAVYASAGTGAGGGAIPAFNPIQTQVFHTLYSTDDNVLVAAPTGSGKTLCLEFALLHMFQEFPDGKARAVYVCAQEDVCQQRYREWHHRFQERLNRRVVILTGETATDLKLLERGEIIISTPEQWDVLSRRWKQRKNVAGVKLFLVDEAHLIVGPRGPVLEVIVSRMRYIASQTETRIRIVAAAASLANAKDLGEWIGAPHTAIFNFHPSVRPVPLEIHIQGFDNPGFSSRMLAMYKPTFLAIRQHSADKPVIVFVPEKKFAYDLAIELIGFLTAQENHRGFLHVPVEAIAEHLEYVKDDAARRALESGIALYHEAMTERERTVTSKLFESGAAQVLVTTQRQCWALNATAHCVIVMGTQYYDGREHRHQDYHITDLLQMMGRACRPLIDECGKVVLFCHAPKKEYYKKFLYDPFPVESHLDEFLADHLNAEIVTKTVESKQDAVDYLTWTFLYRRLKQNPNYYNLQGMSHAHLSDYLSELVENTLGQLEQSKCIAIEDDDTLIPLNLGMIASYYYTQYTTIELFSASLQPKLRLKGLIEILANAHEFDTLPVRQHEEDRLEKLALHLPNKITDPKYNEPSTKANVLLQCHFARRRLPSDLEEDRKQVVLKCQPLIQAVVDVIASNRWLSPALAAMELSQMITQGLWDKDPVLLQLPHFTQQLAKQCAERGVETVFDLLELDAAKRAELLQGFSAAKLHDLAVVCNQYPNVAVEYKLLGGDTVYEEGQPVAVQVSLEREVDEKQEATGRVHAPFYPKPKEEGWWLVIGDPKQNQLFAIKRLNIQRKATVKLEFQAPKPTDGSGKQQLTLFLMSDSYLGCDQEYQIELACQAGDGATPMDEE